MDKFGKSSKEKSGEPIPRVPAARGAMAPFPGKFQGGGSLINSILLETRTQIPPLTPQTIPRPRLIDRLEGAISDYKLITITAPAGYGKTTLLAEWARASQCRIAWLSLAEGDDDLARILQYLLRGWESIQPGIKESQFGLLLGGGMPPGRETVLPAFINAVNEAPGEIVFVFDDYHLIREESTHAAIAFLLDHLPPKAHFVLAGRSEPPLPLARYRARREALEVDAAEVQFTPEEAASFFDRCLKEKLAPAAAASLQAKLEGWAAGMQLAALTLARNPERAGQLTISGKHRYIADYLSEEVLEGLPAETQTFLLQTSILERLCGPLCDAVTGKEGGQGMLERLEEENLFLHPLDENRQWFRYHGLFADFLRAELKRRHPKQTKALHRRAARWLAAQNQLEEAFRHAIEGEDIEQVVEIVENHSIVKILRGEIKTAANWLDSVPEEWYDEYPVFRIARAGFLLATGSFEAGLRLIEEVERELGREGGQDFSRLMGMTTSLRCVTACMQNDVERAEKYALNAFETLTEDDILFRLSVNLSLGDTYRQQRRWQEAKDRYQQALVLAQTNSLMSFSCVHAYGALADLALRQGRLRRAAAHWKKALEEIEEPQSWGAIPLPVSGWVHVRMSEIFYEWNEISQAREHLRRGLERAELGGDLRALLAGRLAAGKINLAEGDLEAAWEQVERAKPLVEQVHLPEWGNRFERLQLEVWLRQGQTGKAAEWAREYVQREAAEGQPENEAARAGAARVLIAVGDAASQKEALGLLEHTLETAELEGRRGVHIEALALQALSEWQRGERANAVMAMERAIRLAEPEGYVRLFVDLGLRMARVLQEARARGLMPAYVEKLLAAFDGHPPTRAAGGNGLPEPLTPREQEVLSLIAAGLTNREIAERLVISAETVKKHTGNIYAKLGVSNRTEAAARGRELDLLKR